MSALPKPSFPPRRTAVISPVPTPIANSTRESLPTSLQVLLRFQQVTSCITLGVMATVLGVYGWTVYTPTLWSREYQQLKALQQTERQLITNTEAIKHQLAQEANQPSSGLVKASPSQNIFLPAQPTSVPSAENDVAAVASVANFNLATGPVAY
ncbi:MULTISPECIES: hypothetical protein [unclassified Synechocystis]|uniref:hypothetical protein n=1 Tax=unclassified Synechocystis TaxID=2640012 RepID=UPI00041EE827|nr:MULTISPECIES: hypothetical protein [unclassified Synechocystis]AIE75281.1 hypothetical protein D082_27530 [Synechocystis sp. PCC 6714]MCT0253023.1 hypothetical protein [Synechocystis sp. CS-94]